MDLSRTIIGGHSAGGQAALQAASLVPGMAAMIDPTFVLRGVVATEPGPLALGGPISVPTIVLTGSADFVVPADAPRPPRRRR